MKKAILVLMAAYLSLIGIAASAQYLKGERCSAEMNAEVAINNNVITMTQETGEQLVIDGDHQISVNGERVVLTEAQQAAVEAYTAEINKTVPLVVDVAIGGVQIGLTAMSEVMYSLTGSQSSPKLDAAIAAIGTKLKTRVRADAGDIYLNATQLDELDQSVEEIEPLLEEVISQAVMDMFSSDSSSDVDVSMLSRVSDYAKRLENLEDDIAKKIEAKAGDLKIQAQALCINLQDLDDAEDAMHKLVPETRSFNLVTAE